MAFNPQFKINQMAKDMGLKSKELTDLLADKGIGDVKSQKSLTEQEFNVLFQTLTEANQVDNIYDYMDGKTCIPSKIAAAKAAAKAAEKAAKEKAEREAREAAERAAAEKAALAVKHPPRLPLVMSFTAEAQKELAVLCDAIREILEITNNDEKAAIFLGTSSQKWDN